jgi:hypothetical protein
MVVFGAHYLRQKRGLWRTIVEIQRTLGETDAQWVACDARPLLSTRSGPLHERFAQLGYWPNLAAMVDYKRSICPCTGANANPESPFSAARRSDIPNHEQ